MFTEYVLCAECRGPFCALRIRNAVKKPVNWDRVNKRTAGETYQRSRKIRRCPIREPG